MTKSSVHVPNKFPGSPTGINTIVSILTVAEKECVRYFDLFSNSYYCINPNRRTQAAQRYAIIKTCKELADSKTYTIKEIFEAYQKFATVSVSNKTVTITNYKSFCRKLEDFKVDAVASCSHGRIDKRLNYKTNPYIIALIHEYLSLPGYYSNSQVKVLVNQAINDFNNNHGTNFDTISKSTVAHYSVTYRNEIMYYRQGKQRFDTATRSYLPRISALNAGSLVQMDGTPIQIFCWNHESKWKEEGKRQIRLNLFALRDAYSGKITGFDMSESEDRYNIIEAIKMMVNTQGHLPAELVHDNFSASKTDEFKAIKKQLEDRGTLVRAAKVGNAQDKGEIERFWGTFQSKFQRLIDGYLGEGIRSKRANGRISEEFITKCQKENGLYDYDEMMKIIAELVAIYNNSVISDKYGDETPNSLYAGSEKPFVKPINHMDYVQMFWLNKEVTIRKSMIVNEVRKSKRFYEIWENGLKLKLNGEKVRIYYEEDEASEIHVYSLSGAFLCTCKQHVQIHEAFVDQQEGEGLRIMKHVAHRDSLYTTIEKSADERVKMAEQFTGQTMELVMPITRAKLLLNDAESQVFINQFYDRKGIDPDKIKDREPVKPSTPFANKDITDKSKKKGKKDIRTATATYDTV